MNSLIAKNQHECAQWKGVAVVVDVLRDSTTLTALLARGKDDIRVFADAAQLQKAAEATPQAELFSAQTLPLPHQDVSPALAAKASTTKPSFVLLTDSAQVFWSLRQAKAILVGSFCNFQAVVQALHTQPNDVLFVPASLFGTEDEEEDNLCAEAFKGYLEGRSTPEDAIDNLSATLRISSFLKNGPATAKEDLQLALTVNAWPIVPQVVVSSENGYGICRLYEQADDATLLEERKTLFKTQAGMQLQDMNSLPQADQQTPSPRELNQIADQTLLQQAEPTPQPAPGPEPEKHKTGKLSGMFSKMIKAVKSETKSLEESLRVSLSKNTIDQQVHSEPMMPSLSLEDMQQAAELKISNPQPQPEPEISQPPEEPLAPAERSVVHLSAMETLAPQKPAAPQPPAAPAARPIPARPARDARKAVVLLSGGLDSTTCLYWALQKGYACEALCVSYGQRHAREVACAQQITAKLGIKLHHITLDLPWLATSSLVNSNQPLPDTPVEEIAKAGVPSTYVPGRNIVLLSLAASLLDSIGADAIIAGPNAVDFSGYPDCTPAFWKAIGEALNRGTARGSRKGIEVIAPLMELSKAEIVTLANSLHVPFELTWSCYAGGDKPCGHCDSCKLRAKGFAQAGLEDPTVN